MENLIIRLNHGEVLDWVVLDETGTITHGPGHIELGMATELSEGRSVIALVPGNDVLLLQANLPRANRNKLLKAAPFALEDQLAADVDSLHFALCDTHIDGGLPVAVVSQDKMHDWLDDLEDAGLYSQTLQPDVLCLPIETNTWSIAIDDSLALVRTGSHAGFTIELDSLNDVLLSALEEAEEKPETLCILNTTGIDELDHQALRNLDINIAYPDNKIPLMTVLAQGLQEKPPINLLQGVFKSDSRDTKMKRLWQVAIAAGVIWFAILLGGDITQYIVLNKQSTQVSNQIESIYKEIFPNAKRVVSPKIRIERELKDLQAHQSDNDFIDLVTNIGDVLEKIRDVKVKQFSFQNNEITVSIEVKDFKTLEKTTQTLTKHQLTVRQDSAVTRGDVVDSRLVIHRNAT